MLKGFREDFGARRADQADVIAVYQILLGRNPENGSVVQTYQGLSLQTVISDLLKSGEMMQVMTGVLAGSAMPHSQFLGTDDFVHACRWLGAELDDGSFDDSASWWLLIDRFLNGLWLARAVSEAGEVLAAYATLATGRADEDRDALDRARSSTSFDPEWFRRRHGRIMEISRAAPDATSAEYFLSIGRHQGMQLLAAFSEGLPLVYSSVPPAKRGSLDAYVEAIVAAAGRGEVGHWLFAAEFCQDVQTKRARASGQPVIKAVSYSQFLLVGDREGWAPHPLFSHYAYRHFNGLAREQVTLNDYLTTGIFENRRTSSLFDPDHYLASCPAARIAILRGTHNDALHHFLATGIYGDASFSPDFDVAYYRNTYPDVVESVRSGMVPSASWHFLHRGLMEGRRPNQFFDPLYYAARHPHVGSEMAMLGIDSELEHFLLLGRPRGLKAEPGLSERRPSLDEAKIVFHRRAMRSFDRQVRAPRDFRPFRSDRPLLSIILPVCNEAPFTALFMESAFFAASYVVQGGGGSIELIVVDNGSTDQTDMLLQQTLGITVVRLPDPVGYPRAIKAGMELARGRIVIVANNDVLFPPDTLEKAVAALDRDETIGVLGPMVVLPDETIQDAGSFVDRDGGIVNMGRYENPWDAYFRSAIDVDYCTGCFFAFRRDDYEEVGGIDDSYSPGYYEEVDFIFRMRERMGKRAVVMPDLQVTHFEHASFGKGRPPSTAFKAILRNQERFSGRHRHALVDRPMPSELAPSGYARAVTIGRTRLLVIADHMPREGGDERQTRTARLLRHLAVAGHAFDLLLLHPDPDADEYEDARVAVRRGWMPGEDPNTILAEAGWRYTHVLLTGLPQLEGFAERCEVLRQACGLAILCDTGVLETIQRVPPDGPVDAFRDALRLELRSATRVALWICASRHERDLLEEAGLRPAISFAAVPAAAGKAKPGWSDRDGVMIGCGETDALAASAWFADRVLPQASSEVLAMPIRMAGGWRARLACAARLDPLGIDLEIVDTPRLEKLEALCDASRVAVAPPTARSIWDFAQIMAFGVPIVFSAGSMAGLSGVAPEPVGLAIVAAEGDCSSSYAEWIDRLGSDSALWHGVAAAQHAWLAAWREAERSTGEGDRLLDMLQDRAGWVRP